MIRRRVHRQLPSISKPQNIRMGIFNDVHTCDSKDHIKECLNCRLPDCKNCFGNSQGRWKKQIKGIKS